MAIVYLNADTPDGTLRLIQDAQAKYGDVVCLHTPLLAFLRRVHSRTRILPYPNPLLV